MVTDRGRSPERRHPALHRAGTGGLELAGSLDQVTLSSGSIAFDEQTRQDYLDGADGRIDDQLAQITTEPQTVVTLTSRDGMIPLTINNGLDYPVQVTRHPQERQARVPRTAR